MTLELTTRSRRRGTRVREITLRWASGLLILLALTSVLPAALGLSSHTVSDDAMGSTMRNGSAVIVDSVPVADLKVGDVITYASPVAGGTLITRRIAQIDPGAVRTSGDGTGALDPWTVALQDSTQDRAVAHVPYAGYVLDVIDVSVRWWLAGFLVLLVATLSLAGVVAARRDEPSQTSTDAPTASPAHATDATNASFVQPPRPRRDSKSRRRSSV